MMNYRKTALCPHANKFSLMHLLFVLDTDISTVRR